MTPIQWRNLTPSHQAELWPTLSNAEKAAIIADDKEAMPRVAVAMAEQMTEPGIPPNLPRRFEPPAIPAVPKYRTTPFQSPAICSLLNVLALLSVLGGILCLVLSDTLSGIVLIASGISLLAWAQMLDHIAQVAHNTREIVGLLARRE